MNAIFKNYYPDISIEKINIKNALEAAVIISRSNLYIGNQSLFFSLADTLNHPRLLESYEPVPNVIPANGHTGSFIFTSNLINMAAHFFNIKSFKFDYADNPPKYLLSH